MAIIFDENNRLITLNTKNSTYQMKIDEYGFLLHLYYGKRLTGDMRYVSCEVCKGKYQIPGLPAAYDETGAEGATLKVYLEGRRVMYFQC